MRSNLLCHIQMQSPGGYTSLPIRRRTTASIHPYLPKSRYAFGNKHQGNHGNWCGVLDGAATPNPVFGNACWFCKGTAVIGLGEYVYRTSKRFPILNRIT